MEGGVAAGRYMTAALTRAARTMVPRVRRRSPPVGLALMLRWPGLPQGDTE